MRMYLYVLLFMFLIVPANAAPLWVSATADIYLAGQPTGTVIQDTICNQADTTDTQAAVEVIGVSLAPGKWLTFDATGSANNNPQLGTLGPDGDLTSLTTYDPMSGVGVVNGAIQNQAIPVPFSVSGHANMPINALIGVFTTDFVPSWGTPSSLPPSIDYSSVSLDSTSFTPEIRQVFYIGDGETSSGIKQMFFIPEGATHFYLGINDGPGTYCNNSGGFSVIVNLVPEPSSVFALCGGLACVGGAVIRTKKR